MKLTQEQQSNARRKMLPISFKRGERMTVGSDRAIKVALAQVLSTVDPKSNADLVEKYAREASQQGARLIVFPEATMRCFGEPLWPIAEAVEGPWAQRIQDIALQWNIVIIVGMFTPAITGDHKVRNTLLVTDGKQRWSYDKIHLYDALGFVESESVEEGTELVVLDLGFATIGLTTCFDIRFPWQYQELARRGAEILIVSASWAAGPGKAEQWSLLTAARALDSTSYLIACGQADPGNTPTASTPTGIGLSRIISPWGEVLHQAGSSEMVLIADIQLAEVDVARASLPILAEKDNSANVSVSTGRISA